MLSNSMVRAGTLVLTDFGVCLLVEHVRVILCERQRSHCGGILDYCTRLKCVDGVLAGPLLPHCLPVACFFGCIGRCWMEGIMGLELVLQRRVWEVESLDGLLIMLAINHACISSGLRIIEINKQ